MRRAAAWRGLTVAAALLLAGCGGSSSGGTGGATGTGGSAGTTGTGGQGAAGGAGLPSCTILTHPSPDAGACSTFVTAGPLVPATPVVDNSQGGVVEDSGVQLQPAGGTILNGDYDLVRWENNGVEFQTQRTIRVFGGGSYVEWDAEVSNSDGGFTDHRYDTQNAVSGHTFGVTAFACGDAFSITSYGYTATGDDLVFFNYTGASDGSGNVYSVDAYRRTCTRP